MVPAKRKLSTPYTGPVLTRVGPGYSVTLLVRDTSVVIFNIYDGHVLMSPGVLY